MAYNYFTPNYFGVGGDGTIIQENIDITVSADEISVSVSVDEEISINVEVE